MSRLVAPPSAVKQHAKLKRTGRLGEFFFIGSAKRKPKARKALSPTSAAPTIERKYKEPYGWEAAEHTGEQVSHRRRTFLDVYDCRIQDDGLRKAADLLQRAYELTTRVRMISGRAYTGMPFAGGDPDKDGHLALGTQDRADLAMLARTVDKLTRVNPVWWDRLKDHILSEPDGNGRFASVNELGARLTGYKRGTDNATAAGVAAVIDALIAFEIARQESAIELHFRDEKKRKELQRMLENHAKHERDQRRRLSGR